MNKRPFAELTLKGRILLLTIVPMLIITTALTTFLIVSRQKDAREELLAHTDTSIRYLSRISDTSVLTGDLDGLNGYAKASLDNENVKGVAFYDQKGALLISAGTGLAGRKIASDQVSFREKKGQYWLFQSPVFESEIQVVDMVVPESGQDASSPDILGWVQLLIDEQNLRDRQQAIQITGLTIGGGGFLILVLLALQFSRSITRPLSELSKAVAQMEVGDLDTRLNIEAQGELGVLVGGINQLVNHVQQSSEELQGKVDHATRRLRLALLRLKQKNTILLDTSAKLTSANAAKDAFLARMSHELRTPINSVIGYCRLLSRTGLHSDQKDYIQIINEASSLLLETSDDILDFSKLQSDAIQLERAPFNLESLLESVFAMHAYAIKTKKLELILFIEPDVPVNLIGDVFRLRQVINNLVGNAVKFTDSGYVTVDVSLVERASPQVSLEFRVKDTGIGIKKDVQDRMFEAFQQADVSTSRQYGGTGLGLVISKKLVTLMGGDIWLNSENDSGSEFIFTIKCDKQEKIMRAVSLKPLAGISHAFVYDRNPLSSKAICSYLSGLGTSEVACSQEAIENIVTSIPKGCSLLILSLDSQELQSDGVRALVSSENAKYRGIVLVISSLSKEEWYQLAAQAAFRDNAHHMGKPLGRIRFQSKICALLDPADVVKTVAAEAKPAAALLAGIRIIIAEDNQYNRDLLTTILKGYGAEVLTAIDGLQALELCGQQSADVLVLDLHMPRMDGLGVCQKLKAENSELPIIALTADLVADKQKLMDEAGVNLVFYKPFDEIGLVNAIANLSKKTVGRLPAQSPAKSLLGRLPASVVVEEIDRLVGLIKIAAQQGDFELVKSLAHQLRGMAVARGAGQEIQEILGRIEGCFAGDQPDVEVIQVLVRHLNLINLT